MNALSVVEAIIGLLIAAAVLTDVFSSVLVPGPLFGSRGVAGLVRRLTLPAWRHATRRGGRRPRFSNGFAPALFVLIFVSWLLLLLLGFGLVFHAAADLFEPNLSVFSQALYVAGSSILTLGVSEVDAHGVARWLILAAALSGFSIITATVTFILQIHNALHQRETAVLTLGGLAGRPVSAVVLLETMAHLGLRSELPAFFNFWRTWSASVLHSHVAHPVLGYFHSIEADSDWVETLALVLDAATLVSVLSDEPSRGAATLMHRTGSRTAARLCQLFDLEPEDVTASTGVFPALHERLSRCGYSPAPRSAAERFDHLRADYAGRLQALATHFGSETAKLLPD